MRRRKTGSVTRRLGAVGTLVAWMLLAAGCVGDDVVPQSADASSSGGSMAESSTGPDTPPGSTGEPGSSSGEPMAESTDGGDTTEGADSGTTEGVGTTVAMGTDTGGAGSSSGAFVPGPCCEAHEGPGCDDPRVEACVCDSDPECCAFGWDGVCVAAATTQCDACGGVATGTTGGTTGTAGTAGTDGGSTGGDTAGDTAGDTGTGGGDPTCCTPSDVGGCAIPELETCVCDLDAFCCSVTWDALCIENAIDTCGLDCAAPCCSPSDVGGCEIPELETCVCEFDAFCCSVEWDELCVQTGIDLCDSGCGPAASCCEFNLDPGCEDPVVEACVCAFDPSCCDEQWNGICVGYAAIECKGGCEVEGGDGDCCDRDNPTVGCDDPFIEACTCVDDPFCCDVVWDFVCVGGAEMLCGLECPDGTTGGATGASTGAALGSCCEANPSPGCDDPVVEACVCATEPLCCTEHWGDVCAGLATDSCAAGC